MRDYYLRIALSAKGSALKQRDGVEHAPRIDKQPRLDIIDAVHNVVQSLPEIIVEELFIIRTDPQFILLVFDFGVHPRHCIAGPFRFGAADIGLLE